MIAPNPYRLHSIIIACYDTRVELDYYIDVVTCSLSYLYVEQKPPEWDYLSVDVDNTVRTGRPMPRNLGMGRRIFCKKKMSL